MPYTVARPRPVPSPLGLVVKNGSKACSTTSAPIPRPESLTRSRTRSSCTPGVDHQVAAGGHRVPGVQGQVHQQLLDLAGIAGHRRQVRAGPDDQPDVFADRAAQRLLDLADHRVQVEHLRAYDLAAGEGEQLVGEVGAALAGPDDLARVGGDHLDVRLGDSASSMTKFA